MKKVTKAFTFLFFSIAVISCTTPRYMYSPAAQNVPLLVKAGDSKLAATYSSDLSGKPFARTDRAYRNSSSGYDLQGAVAVTDHFAIQAAYFKRREQNSGGDEYADSTDLHYKRNLAEFGVGYIQSLSSRDRVLFQLFGGAGKGRFSFTDAGRDRSNTFFAKNHQADITKFYLQPAIVFKTRGSFAASISTRLSVIRYTNIKTNYSASELMDYELDSLGKGARTFWEPAFTNSFGFRKLPGVRLEYQFGFSTLLSERHIDYRGFNFSVGLGFDLPKLFAGSAGGN